MDGETYRFTAQDIDSLRGRVEILSALHAALERWPEVSTLAWGSESVESFSASLRALLGIGAEPAQAVVDLQVRRLPRAERQRIRADLEHSQAQLAEALAQ